MNILHHALHYNAMDAADYLVEVLEADVLMQDYPIPSTPSPASTSSLSASVGGGNTKCSSRVSYRTALHMLTSDAQNCNLDLIKKLMKKIPTEQRTEYMCRKVATQVDGKRLQCLTGIHLAALHGHVDAVEFLIGQLDNRDANIEDKSGNTPLHWAVFCNSLQTIEVQTATCITHSFVCTI